MENNNYIVSARKYRPSAFEAVVGQEALTETLRNAIRSNHLAHAYLFCGPRGVGKTTCARIFAKTINCQNPTADHDACNECESCRAFNEQRSFNIHELDAASNNSVEDVRSIIEQTRIQPQGGAKYSVFIIDEVHMLSQAAFNALLKTLEEPPSHVVFILATTEKHKVLPTILSRCQVFDFARMTVTDTVKHLRYVAQQEGLEAEDEALNVVAQKADGGMRDALSIFDQLVTFSGGKITYQKAIEVLNVLDFDNYFRLINLALAGADSVPAALLLFNDVLCNGFDAGHFLSGLASHLRDLLVSKDPSTAVLLETSDAFRKQYVDQTAHCSAQWLFKALDLVCTAEMNYRTARNKRLTVELMLVKLCNLLTPAAAPVAAPAQQTRPVATSAAAPAAGTAAPKAATMAAAPQTSQQARPAAAPVATAPAKPTQQATPAAKPITPGTMFIPGVTPVPAAPSAAASATPNAAKTQEESRPFTVEQMANAWKELGPSLFAGDERTNAMLTNMAIEQVDELTYCYPLLNKLQMDEMTNLRPKILRFLGEKLHNSHIKLQFRIMEQEQIHVAYTAEERLQVLMELNPHIGELRNTFGLSIN